VRDLVRRLRLALAKRPRLDDVDLDLELDLDDDVDLVEDLLRLLFFLVSLTGDLDRDLNNDKF
jgi:hypothetical protein